MSKYTIKILDNDGQVLFSGTILSFNIEYGVKEFYVSHKTEYETDGIATVNLKVSKVHQLMEEP